MESLDSKAPAYADGCGLVSWLLLFFFVSGVGLPVLWCLGSGLVHFEIQSLSPIFFKILARSLFWSFAQALSSALLACLGGILLGTLLAMVTRGPGRWLATLNRGWGYFAFSVPTVTVALLILQLSSELHFLPQRGTPLILWAHFLMNVCFVAAAIENRLRHFLAGAGGNLLESAATLGARGPTLYFQSFRNVWWNESKSFFPLIFMWSFSAFSTVLILGGGPEFSTPEVLLYYSLKSDFESTRILAIMAVQFLCAAGLSSVALRFVPAEADYRVSVNLREFKLWSLSKVTFAATVFFGICVWPWLWLVKNLGELRAGGAPSEEVGAALGITFALVALTVLFSAGVFVALLASHAWVRRTLTASLGISAAFLLAAWLLLRWDLWAGENLMAQLLLAAVAMTLLKMPLYAFWIERRLQSIHAQEIEAAWLMGCAHRAVVREIFWSACRDIWARVLILAGLSALGEIVVVSFILTEATTLAGLSQKMAVRYDFSGAAWIVLILSLATIVGLGIERKWLWAKRSI